MANGFKIEDNVLLGCSKSAVKVTIPDGVERLDERAFKGCTLLETIEIPATVSKLDIEFSRDCDSLTSVKLSEGVKEIKDYPVVSTVFFGSSFCGECGASV